LHHKLVLLEGDSNGQKTHSRRTSRCAERQKSYELQMTNYEFVTPWLRLDVRQAGVVESDKLD
jgi:hypothetical protein